MFKPNFHYTNKIVRLLTRISTSREIILNSPLIPKWELTLRREAIIHSAHSSTSIEGNRLSLEQVSDLAHGREVMATLKDKREVLNYLGVLESIVFSPPKNEIVPRLVMDLVKWINSEEAKELEPVIEAGIVHYEFVRIHPFIDGNGRTARVLATLVLYLRGFDTKQFFCLDDYYDSDRQAYYRVLQNIDQKTLDLTPWLEYFVEGVNVSIGAVKERVVRLSSERLRKAKRGQIALTERQMRIVEFINQNGKITNRDVREMFKISDRAALKEIRKLVDLKVIKSEGKGRSLSYVMA